jgi:hypothetical protein
MGRVAATEQQSLVLLRSLAGPWADRYVGEVLLPTLGDLLGRPDASVSIVRERLSDPYLCLRAIYGHYAFSRRAGDGQKLGALACGALRKILPSELLGQDNAHELWFAFSNACAENGLRPMEQLNYGVIAGLGELAQTIHRHHGGRSIASWIAEGVLTSGRIENQFMQLSEIVGVGPIVASAFLRDVVFLHHLEDRVEVADRVYVQPIERWHRLIAPHVIFDIGRNDAGDRLLAAKLARGTRAAGASGIRFNMGAAYFGTKEVRVPEALEAKLQALISPKAYF